MVDARFLARHMLQGRHPTDGERVEEVSPLAADLIANQKGGHRPRDRRRRQSDARNPKRSIHPWLPLRKGG